MTIETQNDKNELIFGDLCQLCTMTYAINYAMY